MNNGITNVIIHYATESLRLFKSSAQKGQNGSNVLAAMYRTMYHLSADINEKENYKKLFNFYLIQNKNNRNFDIFDPKLLVEKNTLNI